VRTWIRTLRSGPEYRLSCIRPGARLEVQHVDVGPRRPVAVGVDAKGAWALLASAKGEVDGRSGVVTTTAGLHRVSIFPATLELVEFFERRRAPHGSPQTGATALAAVAVVAARGSRARDTPRRQ